MRTPGRLARSRRALLALALIALPTVLALLAPLARAGGDRGPSPVVFGPQRLPLAFSHAQHVGALAMPCTDCHDRARTSRSAVDLLTPTEAPCRRCHAIDRGPPIDAPRTATGACVACHPGWQPGVPVARVVIPPPSLKFSHAAHATTACTTCHASAATAGLATRAELPTMELCLGCHDGSTAARTCTTCHLATAGGRVRTPLADGALTPRGGVTGADHAGDFKRDHASIARSNPAACAQCHEERECADCHQGVLRPMDIHPADYLTLHAVDARRNVPDCSACHRSQTFCIGCHERAGLSDRARPDTRDPAPAFHPAGWASRDRAAPNLHAGPARANLRECTSCHREQTCLACHTAEPSSPRISPHGPAWRNSSRCRALASRNPRLCLRCHISLTPVPCD